MKSSIWLVVGTVGLDREDREWWIVRAYADERDAVRNAAGATDEAAQLYARWNERLQAYYEDETNATPMPKRRPRPRFDPHMWTMGSYQQPTYHVEEVQFVREGEA